MSRYVDIDLLIARLKEHSPQTSKVKVAQIATKGVPVIELEPKHGEWENYKDEHRCSNCGEVVIDDWYDTDDWYNFCPICGAKMKGADDE